LVKGRVHSKQVSKSIGYSYHNPEQDMFWNRSLDWLIEHYPNEEELMHEINNVPNVEVLPIDDIAKNNSMPKSANIVLLGMAAKYIEILTPEQLRQSIARVFASKGTAVVEMNQKAFDIGLQSVK
jgi:indolepyruvate ferredoxin oxidoreductase beta subunit